MCLREKMHEGQINEEITLLGASKGKMEMHELFKKFLHAKALWRKFQTAFASLRNLQTASDKRRPLNKVNSVKRLYRDITRRL